MDRISAVRLELEEREQQLQLELDKLSAELASVKNQLEQLQLYKAFLETHLPV